jgi:radical SAM protein with 4Fe4S-binding SPASM domain
MKNVVNWIKENNLWNEIYIRPFERNIYCSYNGEDKNWCGATSSMLAMDYKGDLYPCIRFMESSLGSDVEPYKIGSLKEGIGTIEIYKKRLSDLESLKMMNQSTEECIKCPIGKGCSWCSAYNY